MGKSVQKLPNSNICLGLKQYDLIALPKRYNFMLHLLIGLKQEDIPLVFVKVNGTIYIEGMQIDMFDIDPGGSIFE